MLSLDQLSQEQLQEMSLIELAHAILNNQKQPLSFHDLLTEIAQLTGRSESEIREKMVQFYTDLNIDGRFLCIGENKWGLRAWYPVEQIEEETAPTIKPKKKKAKKIVDEDLDDFEDLDDEDLDFDDLDDYDDDDLVDDVDDDDYEELDEEDEFDEDLVEDDYDLDDELEDEDELDIEDDEEEL
jgi:DNA-directed RNA polymerase subunit delta